MSKTLSRRKLLLVALAGLALCIALIWHFIQQSSNLPAGKQVQSGSASPIQNAVTLPKHEKTSSELPARLKIPRINVDSAVEQVGLTPQGEMGVPKGPAGVAWYNLGPRPGEKGSSVIDGHFDWENGLPAVFNNLYKLSKGDKLYVEDDKGATITFVVRESRSYDPQADAWGVFFSSDTKAHLNLITCQGAWDKAQKSYSNRLVVFADKE